jgi:hypothetical protein
MDRQALIAYWKKFFSDLFVGSIIRLIFFSGVGFLVGIISSLFFKSTSLVSLDINSWFEWILFGIAIVWNICFGVFHGALAATIKIIHQKFMEATTGLQGLLDILSREVITNLKSVNKSYTKEEAAKIFSQMGNKFLNNLELKGGIKGTLGYLIFVIIIKVLRFFFLNEISERILAKEGKEATTSDIESAVRHVGVNKMLEPISDNLTLVQIANFILFCLSFGFPFFLIWIFN